VRAAVLEDLRRSFAAYRDLMGAMPQDALSRRLSQPSNSIGAQLWCVVGARESYSVAIGAGSWQGFSCSLSGAETKDRGKVLSALERSSRAFESAIADLEWTVEQERLLLDLLEHEMQHQGQLIRYVYALGYEFPESWERRWNL